MSEIIKKVRKRDGSVVDFDKERITNAIFAAAVEVGGRDRRTAERLSDEVVKILEERYAGRIPVVEDIQDVVEKVLIERGHARTAKAYILYRKQHEELRKVKSTFLEVERLVDDYLGGRDWRVRENSNMGYSLSGLLFHIATSVVANYTLDGIYTMEVADAHVNGDMHIHDLGMGISGYCAGWSLGQLLAEGFNGVPSKVASKPPAHLDTALLQMVNFIGTLQNEWAGAQAFNSVDTLLAPFVRKDGLSYKQVKQAMQTFVFNLNIASRWGGQCVSEDTEALTSNGWKKYQEIGGEDKIATFNVDTGKIEFLKPERVAVYDYDGYLVSLKNRVQEQLVTPNHKVVRKKFNSSKLELIEAEKLFKFKTPVLVPIAAKVDGGKEVDGALVQLCAWLVAEGSFSEDRGRVSIFQSEKNKEKCEEIRDCLRSLGLRWDETKRVHGFGKAPCIRFRLGQSSSKWIRQFMNSKEIPGFIQELSPQQIKLFVGTLVKGDGHVEENGRTRFSTKDKKIKDQFQALCALGGYGTTNRQRKDNEIWEINIIRNNVTNITHLDRVKYKGKVWCPTTKNGTFVARRKGKVFITGNTPFTNITLDLTVPKDLAGQYVTIGGKLGEKTYEEYAEEMEMIDRVLMEVMMDGDMNGRPFTFPIPTFNLTKDFEWDNGISSALFEMTAKYGLPYFQNFINSNLNPSDVRSMCCHLRLDLAELRRNVTGGLFGSSDSTGSVGVVTINMPRLGYLSRNEDEFFERLGYVMELARISLESKREMVTKNVENGLLPFTKRYLGTLRNHFSTIGLIGMNEACLNLLNCGIAADEGKKLAVKTLKFMLERIQRFQEETGNIYNLEATPAEGVSYRLAKIDKKKYSDIITAGEMAPYYTNSTTLPVNSGLDLISALKHQEELQTLYTGGCVEKGNKVLTDRGLLKIEEIVKNFEKLRPIRALSYNEESGVSEWDDIVDAVAIDVKKHNKIRVKGERNLDITTSDWHPFLALEKIKVNPACPICKKETKNVKGFAVHLRWNPECRQKYLTLPRYETVEKRADELKAGDYILQNSCNLYPAGSSELNDDLMWLVGFYIGDGCLSEFVDNRGGNNLKKHKVRFFSGHRSVLEKVAKILDKYFGCEVKVIQNDKRSKALMEVSTSRGDVSEFLLKLGFKPGEKVYNVSVPKKVKENITRDNVFSLLSGLMDSDGHLGKRDSDFEYQTVSANLAEDLLEIFVAAGINISKTLKKTKRKNEVDIYRLRIPQYQLTKIKDRLDVVVNLSRIKDNISNRKRRHLPVVRVKEVSKADVGDNQFFDLTTEKNHNYLAGKDCLTFIHNTVMHLFIGESLEDGESCRNLVRKVAHNTRLPYFTVTPTYTICDDHGFIPGEYPKCPSCGKDTEVYSRVVGYFRPVRNWNVGKQEEFRQRIEYT